MIQLATCSRCNGFLALALRACPHCGAELDRVRRALVALAGLAGGGAVSMTLMACYGPACVDENDARCKYDPDADAAGDVATPDAATSTDGSNAALDGAPGDAAIDAADAR